MYSMKKVITYDGEILLPKCMYPVKNPNDSLNSKEIDINISAQVLKFLKLPNKKMTELQQRQDQLLKKLDILYDRIKAISSICSVNSTTEKGSTELKSQVIAVPEEIVLNINPDNLPWYINLFLKDSTFVANITWHIHSSVPNEKVPKVEGFLKNIKKYCNNNTKVNLRLIFKSVSAEAELKLSSLDVPIEGNVNILRYLSLIYPNIAPYDPYDYYMDSLLDLCHLLVRTPEKNKEALLLKLFSQYKNWIFNNKMSIVDLAAYNIIKQLRNKPKSVPKEWFEKCDKLCM